MATLLAALGVPARGGAAPEIRTVEIDGLRVRLGDLVSGLPPDVASVDLGPAPPPGATRLVARDELVAALPAEQRGRPTPAAVRIVRKMRRLGAAELERLAVGALARSGLPRGVSVTAVRPPPSAVVPVGFDRVEVALGRPPRREGSWSTVVPLELFVGAEEIARVPLQLQLRLGAEAARPDVPHGTALTLVVVRGGVEVSTAAVAGADADVGDVVTVSVRATGKVVRARIVAPDRAELEGIP
jgi:hypothetical protein